MWIDIPNDSGPIYQETIAGRFPVEPFNTFSNLLFLVIAVYYAWKVYKDHSRHRFLAFSLPFLFLGYIGGTVYHATRSHDVWMYMDWLPIVLLCFAASFYFINMAEISVRKKVLLTLAVFFLVFGVRMIPWPVSMKTSAGYLGTAVGLLLPIFVYLHFSRYRNLILVILALVSFSFAISFRIMDNFVEVLPMGTHWLWHIFGAISVFFLITYIYKDGEWKQYAVKTGK